MKKTRAEKGITLIALIITIVVLLILAAVAISSITNDGILQYAQNAADKYNQAVANEQQMLQEYINFLNNGGLGNGTGGVTVGDATVGTPVTSLSTINGEPYSANNPVIPAGFKATNDGADWNAEDLAAEVKKGLVISDGTSEFVWIPVPDLNSFAVLKDGSTTNYRGVLYDWYNDSTGATPLSSSDQGYIEPANLTFSGLDDNADRFILESIKNVWDADYYQESFNKMVESVAKYKGFYVGRYETSLNGSVAQSTSGATPMNNINWWKMYENSKSYSTSNSSLGVVSEMIWGCQWDAMLKLILTGPDASHVTANTNVGHTSSDFTSVPYETGGTNYSTVYTGSTTYNDIASNIYDLEGNVGEWTQEACGNSDRVSRGGNYFISFSPSNRYCYNPTDGYPDLNVSYDASHDGTRLSLYVEL